MFLRQKCFLDFFPQTSASYLLRAAWQTSWFSQILFALTPTEDILADLLVLINSVCPLTTPWVRMYIVQVVTQPQHQSERIL